MSCAACSARVEKAVSEVEGVTSCSVSLLTNSMGVEGTASSSAIIQAVEEAGYGASPKGGQEQSKEGGFPCRILLRTGRHRFFAGDFYLRSFFCCF